MAIGSKSGIARSIQKAGTYNLTSERGVMYEKGKYIMLPLTDEKTGLEWLVSAGEYDGISIVAADLGICAKERRAVYDAKSDTAREKAILALANAMKIHFKVKKSIKLDFVKDGSRKKLTKKGDFIMKAV